MENKIVFDEAMMKKVFKNVLIEVLEEKKELLESVIIDVIEDIGMLNAIKQGEKRDFVNNEDFLKTLDSKIASAEKVL